MSSLSAFLWLSCGRWLDRRALPAQAASCYRAALASEGRFSGEAGFLLAKRLLEQDRNREAAEICEQALGKAPGHARLWCALGAARRKLADLSAAREAYERAIEFDADYAQAWCNLGEWHLVAGTPIKAQEYFERALELDHGLLEAMNNRIAALYELGRYKDAEQAATEAIEAHPDVAALHVNLGNVLLHTGKARPAAKSFRRALECDPACPEAHLNLSTLLGETHHLGAALAFIEQQIALKGESAQRLASLALAQKAKGDDVAAEETCRKVITMQPGNISALVTLAGCLSTRAEHAEANRLLDQALSANPKMPGIYSNIAFNTTYLPGVSAGDAFEIHREWARRFEGRDDGTEFSHRPAGHPDRPLRIGYVSGDFGRHPVGFLLRDVIRYHDKNRFSIHCYSMMRGDDEITVAIRESADTWTDALLMSDDDLADQIHQDRIDILIDLSGHTAYNRLPAFTRRPAPVQATWIGYFHSTGLSTIDYFITDPYTTPADSGQLFSEIPVWLPHSRFCYSPPSYSPDVRGPAAGSERPITFGSFNRTEKLVDPVVDAWSRILMSVPDSRLLLKAGNLSNDTISAELRSRFTDRGIEAHRLDFRGPSSHPEMLEQYREMDIALDTFPFNGGMTTLEALWMGVPVITVAGRSVVSRQTISALSNLGLADELAFSEVDSYVTGAIALAGNRARLAELNRSLRARMSASPLMQAEQFAHDLETLYRHMWHAWCDGKRLPSALSRAGLPLNVE